MKRWLADIFEALRHVRMLRAMRPLVDDLTAWEQRDREALVLFFATSTGKRLLRRAEGVAVKCACSAAYVGTPHAAGNAAGQLAMFIWLKSLSALPAPNAGTSDAHEANADAEMDASK